MNLPEDHMDELFRKAGEMYPLKTDGADWDKVMSRLQEVEIDGERALEPAGSRTSRRWWWLMLLIVPFTWICTRYATHTGTPPSRTAAVATKPAAAQPTAAQPATSPAVPPQHAAAAAAAAVAAAPAAVAPAQSVAQAPGQTVATTSGRVRPHSFGLRDVLAQAGPRGDNAQPEAAAPEAFDAINLALAAGGPDVSSTHGNTDIDRNPDDLARSTKDTVKKKAQKFTPPNGFYAGVVAGSDLSNVKWQQISNPGYTAGVLLGYRFNRRLSAETGLYWDHKAYYTEGEYFDKAKADIYWNMNSIKGTCNMFEIPLNIRWDFAYVKNGSFYATGGISSYMMKKEAYHYTASMPGRNPWGENASYLNSGNNFLSIMNLSLGYSLHWGGVGDVRIEPYFKIPLKGVGIGNLPITSTGIYLGITHSFR